MAIVVSEDKNEIQIVLKKEFYNGNTIREAISDFRDLCSSEINESEEDVKILLKPNEKEDLEDLGYEFSNYVLGLMKNQLLI